MTAPHAPPPPSFVRPVLALLAGLGISVLVVGLGSVLVALVLLRQGDARALQATPAYLVATLVLSGIGGLVGGYVASRLTADRSFYTVLLLAAVLFTSGAVPAIRQRGASTFPDWYTFGIAGLAPASVAVGGLLERRRRRTR
jgi:peptidoglycan/LPS O-acetylase OafA/YrhL